MDASSTSLKRLALSLTLALTAIIALTARLSSAQNGAPAVSAVFPAPNSVSVDPAAIISVTFSTSPTAITSRTFRVHGSMSGLLSGTLSYDDASRTATFDPAQDFKPGELIAVGLTSATHSITGTINLAAPYGWSFTAQAPYGSACFIGPSSYDVDRYPSSIYGADMDGDGDVDLVTANVLFDSISVLLNDGRGVFIPAIPRDYELGRPPDAIQGADLDNDGDIDLVTINNFYDSISVLLNDGQGGLTPADPRYYTVGDWPRSLCLADLDGDGDVDVATANNSSNAISVLSNNGNGTFTPFIPRDYTLGSAYDISCADLDDDGDVDLVAANHRDNHVSLMLNNGSGVFAAPRDYPVGDCPYSVWSGDLDSDGDVDLATANYCADSVSILLNFGDYFSSTVSGDLTVHDEPRSIVGADLDADGDLDLVTANADSDDVSVLLNDGDGVFTHAAPRDYAVGNGPYSVYAADLDGDAGLDLAVADKIANQVSVLLNWGLQIKKAALTPTSWPGQPVTYTLSYTSYDSGTLQGVVISDLVPISLTDVHYAHSGPVVTPTDDLTYAWQIAPLPPGATGIITISAVVSSNLPARNGDAFDNYAIIAHYGSRQTDSATILLDVGLEINKTALTPTSWPGLPVTYTIHYTNHNLGVMLGVVITDQIPSSLTDVHYTRSGPVITPTDGLTYAWQIAPLPPGAMGVITISAIVSPALSADEYLYNRAVIAHNGQQLADTAILSVDVTPKLRLDASAAPQSAIRPGERFTYTFQADVRGVLTTSGWLIVALPPGTHFITATPGFAPASPVAGETINWPLPSGIHYPPSTLQYTLVLTSDGPSRLLSTQAQAVYPDVMTASDDAEIWLWNSIFSDACQRDVALVFDRSGSMQELTRCYGCWTKTGEYPQGNTYPLPFTVVPSTGVAIHCQASAPITYQGYDYISIEAEHYTRYEVYADYHWDQTRFPYTWWAMQRQPNRYASGPDSRGAWMMVGPNSSGAKTYPSIGDIVYPPDFFTTPRLDYGFTVPTDGTYYVWMRALGGNQYAPDQDARRSVHVGLNGVPRSTGTTQYYGTYNDGAYSGGNRWRWTRVLRLDNLNAGQTYTLNFWAAGPGFRLDKIVITNDTRTNLMDNGHPLDWDYPGVNDAGLAETHGRTGWACMGPDHPTPDPRFVPVDPTTGELDDLYDDYQPIRAAKEASKSFVRRLDPMFDQVGYVHFSSSAAIVNELYCLTQPGFCENFDQIANAIESTFASGSTNTAQAIWYGLRVLLSGPEPDLEPAGLGFPPAVPGTAHYGRPETHGMLVLVTDGQPNVYPTLPSGYGNCYSDELWPDQPGESTSQRRARECVVWFAQQARDQGIAIYTIALGTQADIELLIYVAELTGGRFYFDPGSADNLGAILEAIEAQTTSDCLFSSVDVAKQVTPETSVTVGKRLTYTLQTTLNGWIRPSLWLSDPLPAHTALITATPGFTLTPGGALAWPLPSGVFAPALVLTHTLTLSVTGVPSDGLIVNQASAAGSTGSVGVPILPVYQLSKHVEPSSLVNVGQRVTYTLVITTNRPDLPAILSDTLPPGTAFIFASGDYAPVAPGPGDTLTWPLAPDDFINGQVTHTLALSVTDVPPGGLLTNRAGIAGTTDSATLSVLALPAYQLSKRVEPSSLVAVGQRVTYTLVVTTNRPDLPAILSDTLPPGTAFISASGDYAPVAPGPGDTLTWPLAPGDFINGQVTHTLVLSVTDVPPGGLLTNRAGIAGTTDSATLNVLALPTYQLSKRVEPSSLVTVGQRVTYTLVVTTNRPDLPAILSDTLPVGTAFISAGDDYTPIAPGPGDEMIWPLEPADFVGGVAQRSLVLAVTEVPSDNLLTNTASVAGVADSAVLTVLPGPVPLPDLVISQASHQPDQPVAGQPLQFFVTVRNQGSADASGQLVVELYAKGSDFTPAGPPTGPADHAGGWCADPPACEQARPDYLAFFEGLAAGDTLTLSYTIALDEPGSYQVYAQVDVGLMGGATHGYGALLESDEGNNVFSYGAVTVQETKPYKLYLPLIAKSQP